MRLTQTQDIAGRAVTVKELTVGEIRQWLKALEGGAGSVDVIGGALFEDLTFADLQRFTDLAVAEFDAWAPSELRQLIALIKEINPDFFLLRGRLVVLGLALVQQGKESS